MQLLMSDKLLKLRYIILNKKLSQHTYIDTCLNTDVSKWKVAYVQLINIIWFDRLEVKIYNSNLGLFGSGVRS